MHAALPWHERMVVIAEYPQKNAMFGAMDTKARRKAALEWIATTTGIALNETEYKRYPGLFRNQVERKLG
ncbi:hypothetical protein G6F31_021890 [Rhizopus arrhizus]|nr:hypothetical protein G6F31_021890 [Rhizopus arrhizus]